MGGFSVITGDQFGSVMNADNASFDGTTRGGVLTTNGQFWIGNNASPRVRVGTITSPDNSITVGYSAPDITLQVNTSVVTDFHISPFIVSPNGLADGASFTTIQSAINAANAAGGGVVYIQPFATPYIENLTLFDGVHLYGTPAVSQNQGATVTIQGTHTPPNSGQVAFNSICFVSTTNVFDSVAAGSTHLAFLNCESAVQNGYFLNLPNWTGTLEIYDNNPNTAGAPFAVNDGGINNTGGSTILVFSASVGSGTNVMNLSGPVITEGASFGCPVNFQTGSNINLQGHEFLAPVTFSNNTTGVCYFCDFEGGASAAITMSSSGAISLLHGVVNSSNNPAIAGAGAGTLTYANLTFPGNSAIAGTLTTSTISWRPYSQAIAATDGTKVGTCAFNSAQFTVDANGFVTLAGGGQAIDSIGVDAATAPGTNPVLPTVAGLITVTGGQVAAGTTTNVIRTNSLSANTYTIEIQRSQAVASSTVGDNGVCHFNSGHFTVDSNGFVSSLGGGFPWIDQGTSITLAINTGYFVTAATTQTLPASPSQGDVVKIICDTTGAVVVTANTGQTIRIGNTASASAGNATSTQRGDSLELIYRAATTQWIALNSTGNWVVT